MSFLNYVNSTTFKNVSNSFLQPRQFFGMCWSCPISNWNQSVLLSIGLWNATLCLISLLRQQIDSYKPLNKENCSSERERLSNKYRISWIIAKSEQVFYRLLGTHFFLLPGDVLELEGEQQLYVTIGIREDATFLKLTRLEVVFRGLKCFGNIGKCHDSKLVFSYCSETWIIQLTFSSLSNQKNNRTRKSLFTRTRKGIEILFLFWNKIRYCCSKINEVIF